MNLATPAWIASPISPMTLGGHFARQCEVERKVGVGVAGKGVAALFDLLHDGVRRRTLISGIGVAACEVDERGGAPEGSGAVGRFRGLCHHLRPAGSGVGHWNPYVGMRLNTAGQHQLTGSVDRPPRLNFQRSRHSHDGDLLSLNSDIYFARPLGGHHLAAANNQVQHVSPPVEGTVHSIYGSQANEARAGQAAIVAAICWGLSICLVQIATLEQDLLIYGLATRSVPAATARWH